MSDISPETERLGFVTSEFASAQPLTTGERRVVVGQALVLLEQLYVHLPLKRAMHGVDPIQRLMLLGHRVEGLDDRQFHDEMLSIFISLRDLQTTYTLPSPYRLHDAVLPFRIERFGRAAYVVTRVAPGFYHQEFRPGVDVTHWNGVPIGRAVELIGERNAGGNPAARRARGVESLTVRPMARLGPPDEEWVVVGYRTSDSQSREIRLPWQVRVRQPAPQAVDPRRADVRVASALSMDGLVEAIRRTQKTLFAPEKIALEQEMAAAEDADLTNVSALPDILEFRTVTTADATFGYLRIRTFSVGDDPHSLQRFIDEVLRILELLPGQGLIVDVRANGGGLIMAAELLLQLFTPRRIEPCRFQFINSPLTRRLAGSNDFLAEYWRSIHDALEIGAPFSDGFPVFDGHAELCNAIGQRYHGPVALVTDALSYGATDIFAAGFQDHGIGPIVGVDPTTGAGGANVWSHALLEQIAGAAPGIEALPGDTGMTVAMRRTTRVGDRQGDPLEDLGVVPDVLHEMTYRDVLGRNEDLIAAVAHILASKPVYVLHAAPVEVDDDSLSITTQNLTRLDVYVDDRPIGTLDVSDGVQTVHLPSDRAIRRVDLRGYAADELVAGRRLEIDGSGTTLFLSRHAALEAEPERLQPGAIVEGRISNIVDFGAFVDLEGIDGLIHISELSWSHLSHPSEIVAIGDTVQVKVLDIEHDRPGVSLSLRLAQEDPWQRVLGPYNVGDELVGTVAKVVAFGALVEIAEDVEGFVHISELAPQRVENPREIVQPGDEVRVMILQIDSERRHLSLSIKRVDRQASEPPTYETGLLPERAISLIPADEQADRQLLAAAVVDLAGFRRHVFEHDWLERFEKSTGTLADLLAREARSWLDLGVVIGYFAPPRPVLPDGAEVDELVRWSRGAAECDLVAFEQALADAQADLSEERAMFLALLFDAPEADWRRAAGAVKRLATAAHDDRPLSPTLFAGAAWCLLGVPSEIEEDGWPSSWRGRDLRIPSSSPATSRLAEAHMLWWHAVMNLESVPPRAG
jgi:predicted RNA-binding protein with RPS1 domain